MNLSGIRKSLYVVIPSCNALKDAGAGIMEYQVKEEMILCAADVLLL